jgi:hypothetical protein
MANVIDNTVMNSSVMWPVSSREVGSRLPAEQVNARLGPEQSSIILRYPSDQEGRGWLPVGMGQNVDMMA